MGCSILLMLNLGLMKKHDDDDDDDDDDDKEHSNWVGGFAY